MMSGQTAKISNHTMAVLLAQEVQTLTTKLEAAEATIKAIGEFAGYEDDGDYVDRHELKALLATTAYTNPDNDG